MKEKSFIGKIGVLAYVHIHKCLNKPKFPINFLNDNNKETEELEFIADQIIVDNTTFNRDYISCIIDLCD